MTGTMQGTRPDIQVERKRPSGHKHRGLLRPGRLAVAGVLTVGALAGIAGANVGANSRDSDVAHEKANADRRVDVALNLGRAGIIDAVSIVITKDGTLVTLSVDPSKPDSCRVSFEYEQEPNGTTPLLRLEQHDAAGNSFSNVVIGNGDAAAKAMIDLCG